MDSPEAVEVEPETETEKALAVAAERIVAAVASSPMQTKSKFNLYELLLLYDFGLTHVSKMDRPRWRTCFSLAASTEGVWTILVGGRISYLGIFWRTKNPHVNLAREIPTPDTKGNYIYIGWQWNDGGPPGLRPFMDHMTQSCDGAEFIAGHDNRLKLKKKRRGRLWVLKIPTGRFALAHALRERNGT